eukprot:gene16267-16078_t
MASAGADLVSQAMAALQRRDSARALSLLGQAHDQAPDDLEILMSIALAQRVSGDLRAALASLDRVLMADPYHFMALLSKAALIEQVSGPKAAALVYRNVLKIAPPADRLPPGVAAPLARARTVVDQHADSLAQHLDARLAEVRGRHGNQSLGRFDEALQILSGRKRPYVSEPIDFHYPQLPAVPFFDRGHFPWFPELEAATDMIRGELEGALAAADADFAPYIDYPAGAPVNQWAELNKSRRWRSLWLWRDGTKQEAACAQCPKTAELLSRLPMCDQR